MRKSDRPESKADQYNKMSKKLVTVFGATGNQGGSVISALLSSPELRAKYALRGVTRDPSKAKAQALAARGVEMVQGDLSKPDTVKDTVQGSYAVFGTTDYWESMDAGLEVRHGNAIADAVFAAGVKHVVWSSLPHAKELTGGKLAHVDHFETKVEVESYLESNKSKHGTAVSYVLPAVFMSNIKNLINPGPDGQLALALHIDPKTTRIPLIDINADTGKWVAGVLEAGPEQTDGLHVQAVSDWMSPEQIVHTVNELESANVLFLPIPRDTFKSFMPKGVEEEMAQNFDLIGDYSYYGKGADVNQAASDKWLLKGTEKTSLREYVQKNGPVSQK